LLNNSDIRASIDDRNETIGKKIRENELKRMPFQLIVGEKEASSNSVSVRKQGGEDLGAMQVEEFIKLIKDEINAQLAQ
jgi:threonyl-tRNA synthetase